jgi:hypothetical protein
MYEEITVEKEPTEEEIKQILSSLIPKSTLLLPSFSAKKI